MASQRTIQDWLVTQISEILYIDPKEINIQETFTSFGLSSRDAVMLSGDLEDWLKRRLSPTLVYEYPTIKSLSIHLSKDGRSSLTSSDGGISEIKVEDQIENLSLEDITVSDVTDDQLSAANLGPIKAVNGNVYPLSHGQRAMWFQHQVAPESIQNPIYKVRVVSPMGCEFVE
jgi:acyl carrier protein